MPKQKMTPSEALVETLVAEGVETVFGIVGSAFMDALDLFPAAGIRFVSVAHEQAAAHAADGLARVTGRPQVCIAQNGPGAANFVSIVTTDIGNNSSLCNAYLKFTDVRQHLAALSWGNCGFAYGAALGAKIGRPKVPVFAFQGDGAYGISGLSEVMMAVREKLPVIAVVANNMEWGAEKKNQIDYYHNRFVGSNLPDNPDYARLAEDMGAKGFKVEDTGTCRRWCARPLSPTGPA